MSAVVATRTTSVHTIMDVVQTVLTHPVWTAVVAYSAYTVGLAIYRLYLSPLARFPGPRLAAATGWYEFYYDAICHGKYTFEIGRMHQEYGLGFPDYPLAHH